MSSSALTAAAALAQRAGLDYAPVRIVDLTEVQALETSIVENLQRRDVHPLEEVQGFAALLNLGPHAVQEEVSIWKQFKAGSVVSVLISGSTTRRMCWSASGQLTRLTSKSLMNVAILNMLACT